MILPGRRPTGGNLVPSGWLLVNGLNVAAQKYRRISQWAPVDAKVLDFQMVNEASGRVSREELPTIRLESADSLRRLHAKSGLPRVRRRHFVTPLGDVS